MKRVLAAFVAGVLLLLSSCAGGEDKPLASVGGSTRRQAVDSAVLQFTPPQEDATLVVIETSRGAITAVLYPSRAPLAVENFCGLAQRGYYNGTNFHRVVQDFVIQGGDATGTGTSGESIWGHPFPVELSSKLHHYTGALCMAAAAGSSESLLSQFYIVATPQDIITQEAAALLREAGLPEEVIATYQQAGGAPYLDNTDTVFGQVLSGMDVVDAIAGVAVDEEGRPKTPVTIESITVTTYSALLAASAAPASSGAGEPAAGSAPQHQSGGAAPSQ